MSFDAQRDPLGAEPSLLEMTQAAVRHLAGNENGPSPLFPGPLHFGPSPVTADDRLEPASPGSRGSGDRTLTKTRGRPSWDRFFVFRQGARIGPLTRPRGAQECSLLPDATHGCPSARATRARYRPRASLQISGRSVTVPLPTKGGTQRMRPWYARSWQPHPPTLTWDTIATGADVDGPRTQLTHSGGTGGKSRTG